MTAKDLARSIPGMQYMSQLRQQLAFHSSKDYWDERYASGDTSGAGSYGEPGRTKASYLNTLVASHNIESVIEFGCGDGHQLSLASYPSYIGLDVSPAAIALCKARFAEDTTKSFFLYDGESFVDRAGLFRADLAISLDVVYHLVEDQVFETYMRHLFAAAHRYVVIYSTNKIIGIKAPHVRHRSFTGWVDANCSLWGLDQVIPGAGSSPSQADFYVYERQQARLRSC